MDEACVGCRHFRGYHKVNLCCNYIFDTGHSRPCPPGAECTVKKPRRPGRALSALKKSQKVTPTPPKQGES